MNTPFFYKLEYAIISLRIIHSPDNSPPLDRAHPVWIRVGTRGQNRFGAQSCPWDEQTRITPLRAAPRGTSAIIWLPQLPAAIISC